MRWTLLTLCAAVAATLWLPGEAAEPVATTAVATQDTSEAITFEQYRDWRINFNERRRSELAAQLAANDLPATRRAGLDRVKSYYDRLAAMPDPERNRLFRDRFDRIDTDHDGSIDAQERAAWRDKRRALYRHDGASRQSAEAAAK